MSSQMYNLIMASRPNFYSGNQGEFTFPIDRFLEYTEEHIKEQFESLDQNAINEIKKLPTLFATEEEITDTRIGKITKIEKLHGSIRVYYRLDENYYPLSNGALQKNFNKLNIERSEFYRGHWAIKEGNIQSFYEEYLKSLTGIAYQLKNANKKVQLIYAFNGMGKTRLSREFKNLIAPKKNDVEGDEQGELSRTKILYYNALTEDLFYWDNDLLEDSNYKLKIQTNSFTDWILKDQGQDFNIITNFQRYANQRLTPRFNQEYKIKDPNEQEKELTIKAFSEVTFSLERGDDKSSGNLKISKGEESNFIWSVFYTLLEQVISILNVAEPNERETNQFDQLEYVFIDDPVSSLDENHLIELAVNLAALIKSSTSDLRFIITTHSPLFYNVLCNELQNNDKNFNYKAKNFEKYRLEKKETNLFELEKQANDSPFSYHIDLISELKNAINNNRLKKYHFSFLRHILEKTSTFLGYKRWEFLLPMTNDGTSDPYAARILNISSHSKHSGEEVAELTEEDKRVLKYLVEYLLETYRFWQSKEENND